MLECVRHSVCWSVHHMQYVDYFLRNCLSNSVYIPYFHKVQHGAVKMYEIKFKI